MTWQDIVTIIGLALSVLGFLATLLGLWYAIRQIHLTKSAADAAKEAALAAVKENREHFQRYIISNIHRLFHEAIIHVDNKNWSMAALRLNDLADQAGQMIHTDRADDGGWKGTTEKLREWAETMSRINPERPRFFLNKWRDFKLLFLSRIDSYYGPFTAQQERGTHEPPREDPANRSSTAGEIAR